MVRITVHREALPHVIVTSLAARTPVQCFSWNVEDCRGVVTLQVRTPQDSTRAWFVSESRDSRSRPVVQHFLVVMFAASLKPLVLLINKRREPFVVAGHRSSHANSCGTYS